MKPKRQPWIVFTMITVCLATALPILWAQSKQAPQTPEQVAYIKLIEGQVGYQRGDDNQAQWTAAAINLPMMTGDLLYANEQSRAEIELGDGGFLRIGSRAYVGFLQNTSERFQLKLTSGTITLRLRQFDREYEIDAPNVAFVPRQPGEYRVDVNENGDTDITLYEGEGVTSYAQRGEQSLVAPFRLRVLAASPQTPVSAGVNRDPWDRWNMERDNLTFHPVSAQYVPSGVYGYDTLDAHGRWLNSPAYGWVWMPNVGPGWQPYREGRWLWVDPFGWTWVSYEPWGWAPYHYGRWAYISGAGWSWVPGQPTVRERFAAALVAFVTGDEYMGWFPLGPGEVYEPVYGRQVVYRPVTQYVNYTHVTVINRTEIYNTTRVYNYQAVDQRRFQQNQVLTTFQVQPRHQNIYVPSEPRAVVRRPPDTMAVRDVHARNTEVPAVRKFDDKLAEIQKAGVVRPVSHIDPGRTISLVPQRGPAAPPQPVERATSPTVPTPPTYQPPQVPHARPTGPPERGGYQPPRPQPSQPRPQPTAPVYQQPRTQQVQPPRPQPTEPGYQQPRSQPAPQQVQQPRSKQPPPASPPPPQEQQKEEDKTKKNNRTR